MSGPLAEIFTPSLLVRSQGQQRVKQFMNIFANVPEHLLPLYEWAWVCGYVQIHAVLISTWASSAVFINLCKKTQQLPQRHLCITCCLLRALDSRFQARREHLLQKASSCGAHVCTAAAEQLRTKPSTLSPENLLFVCEKFSGWAIVSEEHLLFRMYATQTKLWNFTILIL